MSILLFDIPYLDSPNSQLIAGITLIVIGAIISLSKDWKSKTEQGHKKINRLTIFAFVSALIGAWLTYSSGRSAIVEKNRSDAAARQKDSLNNIAKDSIINLNKKLAALALEQLDTSRTILKYSQELNKAYQRISILQGELYKQVTGNGNKPHLDPNIYSEHNPDEVGFTLDNFSKYPIYDISASIMDDNILKDLPHVPVEKRLELKNIAAINIEIGNLGGNMSSVDFFHIKLPKEVKGISYNVRISWRYGTFSQHVAFERDDNGNFIIKAK